MAFDIKTSKWLNESKSGNFVFAPVGGICNVQIFDKIRDETCGEMIGNLAQIIAQLPMQEPIDTASIQIESPYEISQDRFVFNVVINSGGGDVMVGRSIASMFALAKSRGAIIRTHNIGRAASAASWLAIQGTPGYRIMSADAYNLIHYGCVSVSGSRDQELEIETQNSKKSKKLLFDTYEKYTKLTQKEVKKYISVENSGKLFAPECLDKYLCDWILTSDGHLIGHSR